VNEQIAEKVMGWLPFQLVEGGDWFRGELGDDPAYPIGLPDFTTDGNAMLMVIERMRELGWVCELTADATANRLCIFGKFIDGHLIETKSTALTLPEAVCKAALAAMEVRR